MPPCTISCKLIAYFSAVSACISRRIQVRETFNKKRFRCESAFVFSNSTRPRPPGIWTFLKTHFFYPDSGWRNLNHSGNLFSQRDVASDSLIRVRMYVKNVLGSCGRGHSSFLNASADEFKSSGDLIPLCKVYCSTWSSSARLLPLLTAVLVVKD